VTSFEPDRELVEQFTISSVGCCSYSYVTLHANLSSSSWKGDLSGKFLNKITPYYCLLDLKGGSNTRIHFTASTVLSYGVKSAQWTALSWWQNASVPSCMLTFTT